MAVLDKVEIEVTRDAGPGQLTADDLNKMSDNLRMEVAALVERFRSQYPSLRFEVLWLFQ